MSRPIITEEEFRRIIGSRLDQHINRAVAVLNNFGPKLSYDVLNVMLHAIDRKKEAQVLTVLEKHHEKLLAFQHPEIRGRVEIMVTNPTEQTFLRIYQEILKLAPVATAT